MANEAVLRYAEGAPGNFIQDYTVADGAGIEKGALLGLFDPRTASACIAVGQALAGIAAREKIANDGRTRLAVYKKGYFDMVASGAITVGQPVKSAHDANYPNTVKAAIPAIDSGSCILGYAEETASDGETILIREDL